uniref:Solute carrier family 22 member 18 n=1 Tax=Sphenodon punctatus TaxID=8508 RepID=A0A8D0GB78_SPHPU
MNSFFQVKVPFLVSFQPSSVLDRVIQITYVIAAVDLTCLFMQIGILPYLAKSLGLDTVEFGYLQTIFGVLQLLGGPVFGSSIFSLKEIMRLLKLPGVMEIFLIKVLSGLPTGLFLMMFSIISINFFGLEAIQSGYLMTYFGVLQMVVQGLVIGRLTSHFTERTLLMLSVLVFSGVGLALALMTSVFHYCLIAFPMVFALCTIGIITDSILTKAVPPSDTGAMLGICSSVPPLTRTVGPTIGGFLYKRFGVSSFGYVQLAVNIILFLYLLKNKIPQKEEKVR